MNDNFYKQKYLNLRAKFLSSIDMAWRDGYEVGTIEAQQDAMQQQQQMAMQQEQMAQQQGQPQEEGGGAGEEAMNEAFHSTGQPGIDGDDEAQRMNDNAGEMGAEGPMGGELGKNIDALLQMLSKGSKPKIKDLRHAVEKIDNLRKSSNVMVKSQKEISIDNIIGAMEDKDKVKEIRKSEKNNA